MKLERAQPALAAGALTLALFAGEIATRFSVDPPRYHNEPLELDPELGFRGIRGHRSRPADVEGALFAFVLNEDGFRGRPLPAPDTPASGPRLLFIGDSFLVGAGVPESQLMSNRVESALAARGEDTEVYNLSAADYGTGQELLLLRRFGPRLSPDRVVLAVYPQNDLINNFEGLALRTELSPGDYIRPYVVPQETGLEIRYTHPLRAFLRRHSRLYGVVEQRLLIFGARRQLAWLQPFERQASAAERIEAGRAPREHLELFREPSPDSAWDRAWQRTTRLLSAFRDECAAQGARLMVVVIPDLHQVRRTAEDVRYDLMIRAAHRLPLDRYLDWNLPERRLAVFFQQDDIEAVWLLPLLRQAVAAGTDVHLRDRHLNATGHEIAARAITLALAGGPRAPPDLAGRPVRLPGGADAPPMIEPGREDHWPYHGPGWIPWTPSQEEGVRGALSLQRGLVALPARGRELVVRGIAAAHRYPLDVDFEFVSGPRHRFRIEKRGPFVLRAKLPVARLPKSDGYLALTVSAGREGPGLSTGVILQEIGFRARDPSLARQH